MGVWNYIAEKIRRKIDNGEALILTDDIIPEIKNEVDLSGLSREELEEGYLKLNLFSALNYLGYHSVVRRTGFFANIGLMKKNVARERVLDKIEQNKLDDIQAIENVIKRLDSMGEFENAHQYTMDFQDDDVKVFEEQSKNDFIDALYDAYRKQTKAS